MLNPEKSKNFTLANTALLPTSKEKIMISTAEQEYFSHLDQLGLVGKELLELLYEQHLPSTLEHDTLRTERKFGLDDEPLDLSSEQRRLVDSIQQRVAKDHEILKSKIKKNSRQTLLREVAEVLGVTQIDQHQVSLFLMPGALGVAIRDEKYLKKLYPNEAELSGFYPRTSVKTNDLSQKFFIVHAGSDRLEETIKHEYLHFLMANYLEPLELPERTTSFFTLEAKELFRQMRDELAAHAVGGEFETEEGNLLRGDKIFTDEINKIPDEAEKRKVMADWRRTKVLIGYCYAEHIFPEQVLPIFLTSQSFDILNKRLLLLIEARQKEQEKGLKGNK